MATSWLQQALRGEQEGPEQLMRRQQFNQQMGLAPMGPQAQQQPQQPPAMPQQQPQMQEALRGAYGAAGQRPSVPSQQSELDELRARRMAEEEFKATRPGGTGILGGIAHWMGGRNKDEKIEALQSRYLREQQLAREATPAELEDADLMQMQTPDGEQVTVRVDDKGRAYDPFTFEPMNVTDYREVRTPGVQVNTGEQAGSNFVENMFSDQAERLSEAQARASTGLENIGTLERFVQASRSPDAAEGEWAPYISMMKNIGASLGFDPAGLTEETLMQSGESSLTHQLIEELGGSRGVTDRELEILKRSLPNINTSREAREAVAEILMDRQYRGIQEYESYLGQAEQMADQYNLPFFHLRAPSFEQYQQRSNEIKKQYEDATPDQIRELMMLESMGY